MKTRLIALLLAICMLMAATALVACGETPAETSGTTASSPSATSETSATAGSSTASSQSSSQVTTESTVASSSETDPTGPVTPPTELLNGREKHPDYQDVNFGDQTFTFLTMNGDWGDAYCQTYEIYAELTGNDSLLQEAVVDRNNVLESLYHCKIAEVQVPYPHTTVGDDISIGGGKYDFVMPLWWNLWYHTTFVDFAKLDVDLSHSWWDQGYIDCFSTKVDGVTHLSTISGKFNLESYDMMLLMSVNMSLYDQLRATGTLDVDIFDAVRNGTWDMDKFLRVIECGSRNINGNDVLSINDGDIMGTVDTGDYLFFRGAFFGMGARSIVKNDLGQPVAVDATNASLDHYTDIVGKMIDVSQNPNFEVASNSETFQAMIDSKVLIRANFFKTLHSSSLSDTRICVVPFPKFDAAQDRYYCITSDRAYGLRVSRGTLKDYGDISDFLEVFGFHSEMLLYPEYVKYVSTQILYGGGELSEEMFDFCLRSRSFDPGIFHNTGAHTTAIQMAMSGKNNISRSITATAPTINEAMKKWQDDIMAQYK